VKELTMRPRAPRPLRSFSLLTILALALLGGQRFARGQDASLLRGMEAPPNGLWLESLDLGRMSQEYGSPHAGRSVDNHPLRLKGVTYPHGIGTHARSELIVDLKGAATRFMAMAGLDEERAGQGSVAFEVWVDGRKAASTPVLHGGDEPKFLSVDLAGAKRLVLVVDDGGDGITNDHADWAGALLILAPGATARPQAAGVADEPPPPIHHLAFGQVTGDAPQPAIHGSRVVGATPGRPFLFLIPATGQGPLTFAARHLPAGLSLDPKTGIISGRLQDAGTTEVELSVRGPRGSARRTLTVVGGQHRLALTPPLGWNSWNVWAGAVDAAKVRAAADAMVSSGLAAHGFQYVNIDDTWEGKRDASGEITTNSKFPDMKALADYVHGKGLKLGIYSSPGPQTCAGFEGSYQHELQDARTYARWGIDYLKHDWCSYGRIARGNSREELQKPYRVMRAALDQADRDIVFSLCQYGMGNVWEWGAEVGGNCWRTTGDITDTWSSLQSIGFNQDGHEKYAGPGHWNDPDMLIVGRLGWGPNIHPTRLTPNEQLVHISLWSLLASPLLLGCDMTQMDRFTLDLMTNDEVLDVNQDPLGRPAGRRAKEGLLEVWARPLWDGTLAVGLFNRGIERAPVTAKWSDLGLKGRQPVRDLWQQKNLGTFADAFTAPVPAHGALLLKIGRPGSGDLQKGKGPDSQVRRQQFVVPVGMRQVGSSLLGRGGDEEVGRRDN
jgi:alpha-galactosidase